jgi:cell division protease FtsH
VVFNEVTTCAEYDLERATALARQMVCMFGMSSAVGLAHCAQRQNPIYIPGLDGALQRDCSERTARDIDEEVKKILDQMYSEAKDLLIKHRDQLDLIAGQLLKDETIDGQTFSKLIGRDVTADRSSHAPLPPE